MPSVFLYLDKIHLDNVKSLHIFCNLNTERSQIAIQNEREFIVREKK